LSRGATSYPHTSRPPEELLRRRPVGTTRRTARGDIASGGRGGSARAREADRRPASFAHYVFLSCFLLWILAMNIQLSQLVQVQKDIPKRTNAVGDASEASSSSNEINLRLHHGLRKFRHAVRRVSRLRKSRLERHIQYIYHPVHVDVEMSAVGRERCRCDPPLRRPRHSSADPGYSSTVAQWGSVATARLADAVCIRIETTCTRPAEVCLPEYAAQPPVAYSTRSWLAASWHYVARQRLIHRNLGLG
jgi:hypothetical protein